MADGMFLSSRVELNIRCPDAALAIDQIRRAGINIDGCCCDEEELILSLTIRRRDEKKLNRIAERHGWVILCRRCHGIPVLLARIVRRPVLLFGIVLFTILSLYVPGRIFFVRIEGNTSVPTRLILEKSAQSGIAFGASRKDVRSQKVKDRLLEAIPQLQWAGVTTDGCTATVYVRERSHSDAEVETEGVFSLIAARDGVISRLSVTAGNTLCHPGQAVEAGQLLVSAYTDCGIMIRAESARGEIYALTQHHLTVAVPSEWLAEADETAVSHKFSVIIGKKRINFYKSSGISGGTCDKMYEESYVTLPGGFQLPVRIVREVWTDGGKTPVRTDPEEQVQQLELYARGYLLGSMVAGHILGESIAFDTNAGAIRFSCSYACEEMIAVLRNEEIVKPNGNDYGTDRQR